MGKATSPFGLLLTLPLTTAVLKWAWRHDVSPCLLPLGPTSKRGSCSLNCFGFFDFWILLFCFVSFFLWGGGGVQSVGTPARTQARCSGSFAISCFVHSSRRVGPKPSRGHFVCWCGWGRQPQISEARRFSFSWEAGLQGPLSKPGTVQAGQKCPSENLFFWPQTNMAPKPYQQNPSF